MLKKRCKVMHKKLRTLKRRRRTSRKKSCVWKTSMKNEEQLKRVVCSKATRTHRVVEEQQQALRQSFKVCGIDEQSFRRVPSRLSAEVEEEEDKPEAGGQHTEPAAAHRLVRPAPCIEFRMIINACVLSN